MRRDRERVVRLPQHYPGQRKSLFDTPRCVPGVAMGWGRGHRLLRQSCVTPVRVRFLKAGLYLPSHGGGGRAPHQIRDSFG